MKYKIVLCIVLVLAAFSLSSGAKVDLFEIIDDLSDFNCNERSPIEPAVFSNTMPQVALTHIFCGQIKQKSTGQKQAQGWHSRPGDIDPPCAMATGILYASPNTAYYATAVAIYDAEAMEWIPRTTGHTKYYFFPTAWDIVTTVNILIDVYERCNGASSPQSDVCIKNYVSDRGRPFDIALFLDQERRIVSAFPMPQGSCRQRCEFV